MKQNIVIFMLCCLLLIFSYIFADDTVTFANLNNDELLYKQAVNKLCEMNIIEIPESESFMTDEFITRVEAAIIVVKFAGYGNMIESSGYPGDVFFKDIKRDDWFNVYLDAGYVL